MSVGRLRGVKPIDSWRNNRNGDECHLLLINHLDSLINTKLYIFLLSLSLLENYFFVIRTTTTMRIPLSFDACISLWSVLPTSHPSTHWSNPWLQWREFAFGDLSSPGTCRCSIRLWSDGCGLVETTRSPCHSIGNDSRPISLENGSRATHEQDPIACTPCSPPPIQWFRNLRMWNTRGYSTLQLDGHRYTMKIRDDSAKQFLEESSDRLALISRDERRVQELVKAE